MQTIQIVNNDSLLVDHEKLSKTSEILGTSISLYIKLMSLIIPAIFRALFQ